MKWNSFEGGLLIILILLWLVNATTEKTSLGRILMGRKSELYPFSTFSVYLSKKLTQTKVFSFRIQQTANSKPITLKDYDLFYPLQSPHLDDEIATNQFLHIVESFQSGCPTNQNANFKYCKAQPAKSFHLQPDVGEMFARSIRHHTGIRQLPEKVIMEYRVYPFNSRHLNAETNPSVQPIMVLYPRKQWLANDPR